jgi:FtsP/CotA-like multicopper oxidase with cupredoxin domain
MALKNLSLSLLLLAQPFVALGARKEFDLTITWDKKTPADLERPLFLVNGQSPGPTLEIDQGDRVVVRVQNNSPSKTSIHFHGIEQIGTPWSDGVPGVTQRTIKPKGNFTYEFDATQYGSYWYHAHYLGQIENGLMGPIVIRPKKGIEKPFSLISKEKNALRAMEEAERKVTPLMITDLTRMASHDKWNLTMKAGLEMTCYDALLFNGKGRVECIPEPEVKAHINPQMERLLALAPGSSFTDKA